MTRAEVKSILAWENHNQHSEDTKVLARITLRRSGKIPSFRALALHLALSKVCSRCKQTTPVLYASERDGGEVYCERCK